MQPSEWVRSIAGNDAMSQAEKRDEALRNLEDHRAWLIATARQIAVEIAQAQGTVTSPEVARVLQERWPGCLSGVDTRFLGAVFRTSQGDCPFTPVGWTNTGSHARPVRVWTLK